MNLLLLSNSRNAGSDYLEHAVSWLEDNFAGCKTVAFVPYAAVRFSYDDYERMVADAFQPFGIQVRSVHRGDPAGIIAGCDGVAVGGGNTFRLLEQMAALGALEAVRGAVASGKPYAGWSAGSNVACPTIRTTNDMPIIEPPSFDALGLVPFQINPHYLDAHPDKHMGETREERLLEFAVINPDMRVVGLREGSALRLRGDQLELLGSKQARIFHGSTAPWEIEPAGDVAFLLT